MKTKVWLTQLFPQLKNLTVEHQNLAYEGCVFTVDGNNYRSRLAKRTPTKAGYFTAFWQKDATGKNQPFAEGDIQYLLIFTEEGDYFCFPKEALHALAIVTTATHQGKMAMRFYAPHEQGLNKIASKTQSQQAPYYKKRR